MFSKLKTFIKSYFSNDLISIKKLSVENDDVISIYEKLTDKELSEDFKSKILKQGKWYTLTPSELSSEEIARAFVRLDMQLDDTQCSVKKLHWVSRDIALKLPNINIINSFQLSELIFVSGETDIVDISSDNIQEYYEIISGGDKERLLEFSGIIEIPEERTTISDNYLFLEIDMKREIFLLFYSDKVIDEVISRLNNLQKKTGRGIDPTSIRFLLNSNKNVFT